MNKTFTLLALIFVLGCVSADVAWNTTTKWSTAPTIVFNGSDTNLTNKGLSLYYGTGVLVLLAENANGTSAERNITVKGLTYTREKESLITTNDSNAYVYPANNVRLSWNINQVDGVQQISLYKGGFAGAAVTQIITKNTDKSVTINVYQVFAHRNRYFAVFGASNNTVGVVSVGSSDTDVQSIILTNNATATPSASCAGISGKDELYCLFEVKTDKNDTNNKSIEVLAEAVINVLKSSTVPPYPADFFKGTVNDTSLITYSYAYNAGKQYGGVAQVNKTWSVKNAVANKSVGFAPPAAPANAQAPTFPVPLPYFDKLALFWQFNQNTGPNVPPNTVTTGVQYINTDGSVSSFDLLYSDITEMAMVQYSDGSFYHVGANITTGYIGQVWGATGLSGSLLQTAFAAVFAVAAAIALI